MAHIFVIDDDKDISKLIERALCADGHTVSVFNSAADIDEKALFGCELMLLDVMMPGIDGFSFCEKIRNAVDCPIIFLTAKVLESDMLEGFSRGGDDYIKKPFSIGELRARVNAHLRRENRSHHNTLTCGGYRFDLSSKQLYYNEKLLTLTKSEYSICEFLVRHRGQVFTLEQILEEVLGFDSDSDTAAIRVHIKNIRAKMPADDKPIDTVWGIGYKWN